MSCNTPVTARKGDVNQWHFSHRTDDASTSRECHFSPVTGHRASANCASGASPITPIRFGRLDVHRCRMGNKFLATWFAMRR
ncbi:competence protein CoiA family protein [Vibrio nigripulchritudo]